MFMRVCRLSAIINEFVLYEHGYEFMPIRERSDMNFESSLEHI